VIAAATPTSSTETTPACQPDGPTAVSRPLPSGPPANAASSPRANPVATPQAKPTGAPAQGPGWAAARAVSSPPNAPARYGTLSMSMDTQPGMDA